MITGLEIDIECAVLEITVAAVTGESVNSPLGAMQRRQGRHTIDRAYFGAREA